MAKSLTSAEIARVRERARLAADILIDALETIGAYESLDGFDGTARTRLEWIARARVYAELTAYLGWYPERPRTKQ